MENVYIKTDEIYELVKDKYCQSKDIISLDELLGIVEEMYDEIVRLDEENEHLENQLTNDYDPEIEIPQIHGKGISW